MDSFIWTSFSLQHLFSLVMVVLGLALAAQLLRSDRSPGATMAWLLFMMLIPYLGIPLFIMLGGRKIRMTKKSKRVYRTRENAALQNRDGREQKILLQGNLLERVLLSSGAPAQKKQIQFRWLSDGQDAFHALIQMIEGANQELLLTTYIFSDDPTGRAVLDALCARARAGIQVGVLVDSLLAGRKTRLMLKDLTAAGGHVSYFMPLFHLPSQRRANLRNHRKSVIADGQLSFVGGMNIATEYMGPHPDSNRWADLSLTIKGPAAWDLRAIFLSDWEFSSGQPWPIPGGSAAPPRPTAQVNPAVEGQAGLAQVLASGPDVATDTLYEALLTMTYNA